MDNLALQCIYWLQAHAPAEALTLWTFILCAITIFGLLRFYGLAGLYTYNVLAIVVANIQVLSVTQYQSFAEPVALGTVIFTTTFFVNDVITEHYGAEAAKKSVWLGFWGQILVTVWMVLALAHKLPTLDGASANIQGAHQNYLATLQLFAPSIRILAASLIAYFCSQWLDILIFNKIRNVTAGKYLWLRQNVAMFISGALDTFLFSFLAWMLFSSTAISWHELFFTYFITAQIMRFALNITFTPLMYMSHRYVPVAAKI